MSGQVPIPFAQIPANLRVPLFYVEFNTALNSPGAAPETVLIIGQTIAAQPEQPIYISSVAAAQALFGAGSQLANMISAYRANDFLTEIWALPLADATGATKATASITVSGTPTQNGTLFLTVAGALVQVGVTAGQTATAVASAIQAAIAAQATLPVTASVALGVVTLTANNAGTLGNDCPIVLNYLGPKGGQITPAGVTVTISTMTAGATDPTLTTAALQTALGQTAFALIVNPYSASAGLAATTGLLSNVGGRWAYNQQLYGHAITAQRNTPAALLAAAGTLNDPHLTFLGVNDNSPSPAWLWAAAFAGAVYPSLQAQPNQPLQTLPVQGVLPEAAGQEIGFANQQALLSGACALCARTPTGGIAVVRAVTTYLTNANGTPDPAYLDMETLFTLMAVTRALRAYVVNTWGRALLAPAGTPLAGAALPGAAVMATPTTVRNGLIGEYQSLVAGNLTQNAAAFAAGLVVQANANDNSRLDVLWQPNLVGGLRIFAVLNEFYFQAAA